MAFEAFRNATPFSKICKSKTSTIRSYQMIMRNWRNDAKKKGKSDEKRRNEKRRRIERGEDVESGRVRLDRGAWVRLCRGSETWGRSCPFPYRRKRERRSDEEDSDEEWKREREKRPGMCLFSLFVHLGRTGSWFFRRCRHCTTTFADSRLRISSGRAGNFGRWIRETIRDCWKRVWYLRVSTGCDNRRPHRVSFLQAERRRQDYGKVRIPARRWARKARTRDEHGAAGGKDGPTRWQDHS